MVIQAASRHNFRDEAGRRKAKSVSRSAILSVSVSVCGTFSQGGWIIDFILWFFLGQEKEMGFVSIILIIPCLT